MEQVFAPWRIEWVERSSEDREREGCVFCALADADDDAERLVLARNDAAYVVLNNYPYNPGHAMVVPRPHGGDYATLAPGVLSGHARLVQATIDALRAALDPDGFNTGMNLGGAASGGSVGDHVHTHVVPRWAGDTNFMPVVGDTKVIVEALADTYDRVRAAFAEMEGAKAPEGDAVVLEQTEQKV